MMEATVADVMTRLVFTAKASDELSDTLARLERNRISGAPVVEHGQVVGVVSESDLIGAMCHPSFAGVRGSSLSSTSKRLPKVGAVMSSPAVTIGPDAGVWDAATQLHRRGFKRLPVVDAGGRLVGVISRADVIRALEAAEDGRAVLDRSGTPSIGPAVRTA